MPTKIPPPQCRRCHPPIAHLIPEKDAGEWIIRCLECGTTNVLRFAATSPVALPLVEFAGWRDS